MIKVAQIIEKMNMGGIENLVMEYYRHVDRTKVQFDFITSEGSKNVPNEEIDRLGGRVYRVPSYKHLLPYSESLQKIFKEEKYDIVQANLNTMCPFALHAAKQAGVPVRIAQNLSAAHWQEKKSLLKEFLRPFGKCFATHYMANSVQCGRWLFGEKAVNSGKLQIFKTVIDVNKNMYDAEIRKQRRLKLGISDQVVIGHLARFVPQKNTMFVADIFEEIAKKEPKAVLLLIGDGELRDPVLQKLKKMELKDKVLWMGYQKDIPPLYHAMDAFLLPSLYEGLPIVGVEAQMNGLPCFFSTQVTQETAVCDLAHFIPLNTPPEVWAEKILYSVYQNTNRTGREKDVTVSRMNSRQEGKRLTNYYIQLAGKST